MQLTNRDDALETVAKDHRGDGEFGAAGDYFTQRSYQTLSDGGVRGKNLNRTGEGLYYLLHAATNYRKDGVDSACRNRCEQGILLCEDTLDAVSEEFNRGALHEFMGDLRTIGSLDGEEDYYEAGKMYTDFGYSTSMTSEPLFRWNLRFFDDVLTASHYEIEDYVDWRVNFVVRADLKTSRFGEIVEQALKEWDWQ